MTAPIYGNRKTLTGIPGYATGTTCKLLVSTMDDPTSSPVIVVVNGVSYTSLSDADYTLTAFGYCWTGAVTITGLTAFTKYSWSMSQGSETDTGQLMSNPSDTDDFSLIFASCDNNTGLSNLGNGNPQTVVGTWEHVKDYADNGALPIAGLMFFDDYGYVDSLIISDDYDDNSSGLTASAAINSNTDANDASLSWLSVIGSLGTTTAVVNGVDIMLNDDLRTHWGRETNRQWCRRNLNLYPQWGDHEFSQDLGTNEDVTDTQEGLNPNPRWNVHPNDTEAQVEGIGKLAWDAFIGAIQPPAANSGINDSEANHWTSDIGCVRICTLEAVTWGTGGEAGNYTPVSATDPTSFTQKSVQYGTDQIDDVLADLTGSDAAFKILGTHTGVRYMADGTVAIDTYLAHHAIFNFCNAEYKRLITDTTTGLMSDNHTNGVNGTFVWTIADLHHDCVCEHRSSPFASNNGEEFDAWTFATANGSINMYNNSGLSVGDSYSSTYESADGQTKARLVYESWGASTTRKEWAHMRADVYGSETPKRIVLNMINTDGEVAYQRQYFQGGGNRSYAIGESPASASALSLSDE